MDKHSRVQAIIANDPARWRLLQLVRTLGLADCRIGAGFVRNAVWDHLHGRESSPLSSDVDVIWFDPGRSTPDYDRDAEAVLRTLDSSVAWSVKNQARMHSRNGDRPYVSSADAMRHWPETATAVAVRLGEGNLCEVSAPLGLDDLFGLIVRPTEGFVGGKRAIYQARLASKDWVARWPLLRHESSE
ncbi:nucleotidyltransferase family protein [Pseudomonas sp. RIT-PI-AD]|uniref:nucleotidyltransferase family protein n=1 Tax=Pseudomonas sp. RIT-PI-AD TaxID=3035294 RepID=UPI0021DB0D85|nr:nucleotidyltransferase family protein [Pseudomonas sp. RIT-PI-AD]